MHRQLISIIVCALIAVSAAAQSPWTSSFRGAAFGIHNSEVGPKNAETRTFSTNWLEAQARYTAANGFFFGVRGRGSLEPYTVPEEGYPQLLQSISAYAGGPLVDRMRARDLIEEGAVEVGWRSLRLYAAPIGEPALGPRPYGLRESSADIAVAPFAYDIQESYHVKTRVVNGAFDSRFFRVEGGVFHDAVSTGRHTSIDQGDWDSWAARLTVMPTDRFNFQVSRGDLGDNHAVKISSASATYGGPVAALTAMYTRREEAFHESLDAIGLELELHGPRTTVSGRFENVDQIAAGGRRRVGHGTLGFVFDPFVRPTWRGGVGINVDYHTNSAAITGGAYGHKPQTVYVFARLRTALR